MSTFIFDVYVHFVNKNRGVVAVFIIPTIVFFRIVVIKYLGIYIQSYSYITTYMKIILNLQRSRFVDP